MTRETEIDSVAATLLPLLEKRVVIITGAGVSAESGLATFRGVDGHWRNRDPRTLATPQAFAADPDLVWEWYGERRQQMLAASPNAAHRAIAALSGRPQELLVITQNVDNLHERAGTKADELVHVHGELVVSRCVACGFSTTEVVPPVPAPRCPSCQALLRPGVVWFGEALDRPSVERIERFFRKPCDLVIVIGTTAVFGYIVDWALEGRTLVEVNPDTTPVSSHAHHRIAAPAGEVLPRLFGARG